MTPPSIFVLLAVSAAGILSASPALAQPNPIISGTVVDARTGRPVPNAVVSAGPRHTDTDNEGRFRLCRVPATVTSVSIRAWRHVADTVPVEWYGGEAAELSIALRPDSVPRGSILLNRRTSPRGGKPAAMLIVDGEWTFIFRDGCETPPPGVRTRDHLSPADIEAIHVLPRDEAVARFGPEGAHGAVFITTRGAAAALSLIHI